MKQKDTHIVFELYGKGTFVRSKEFDLDKIRVICLEDCLNMGPVCDLHSSENIEKREEWLLKTLGTYPLESNNATPVNKDLETLRSLVERPEMNGNIFLWTGYCASEILSTARFLYHLPKHNGNIFIADFPNIPVNNIHGNVIYPRSLIVCDLCDVGKVAKHFKQLTDEDITKWRKIWEEIRLENSMLRVMGENGKILEKDETYFDPVLVSYCTNEFQKSAKIIGLTLCDIDFGVGDGFLNWRLKQLVLNNKIEARGVLNEIRDYEVRLAQC